MEWKRSVFRVVENEEEEEEKKLKETIEEEEEVEEEELKKVEGEEEEEDSEYKLIQEEHRIWKKNSPFLYDVCLINNTNAGGLSCQWLPQKTEFNKDYSCHELVLGTKQGSNSLQIMKTFLPNDNTELEVKQFNEKTNELGDRNITNNWIKFEPIVNIVHDGDVNRVRYMPNNHFVVATRMEKNVAIFKYDQLPSKPKENEKSKPYLIGQGHTLDDGYGLDWSSKNSGLLASCGQDGTFIWNINQGGGIMKPIHTFSQPVTDCAWSVHEENILGTVSLTGEISQYDLKSNSKKFVIQSKQELNAITFNPEKQNLFITGGQNKIVQAWDDRKLSQVCHEFRGHTGEIYGLQFAPFNAQIFASCSEDRRVMIWDMDNIGKEQTAEEAEDGDPELIFIHGGHCGKVMDISWNPNDDWVIASVADNGETGDLQIWQPAEHIYLDNAEEEDEEIELE